MHQRMNIQPEEIKAFCNSLVITIKTSKFSRVQEETMDKMEKTIHDLCHFMCTNKDKRCEIM